MKKLLYLLIFILLTHNAVAAIDAMHNFERGVPSFISVNGNGEVCASTEKFKDGKQSVKYSWNGESEIIFANHSEIEASMKVNGSGLMMWVYNTAPMN